MTLAEETSDRASNRTVPDIPPDLEQDGLVLPRVSEYLAKGLALRRWWAELERRGGLKNSFRWRALSIALTGALDFTEKLR